MINCKTRNYTLALFMEVIHSFVGPAILLCFKDKHVIRHSTRSHRLVCAQTEPHVCMHTYTLSASSLSQLRCTTGSRALLMIQSPQFFLDLGVSYFLLLEYQRSRGMPIDGRVITPNAAQSNCRESFTINQNLITEPRDFGMKTQEQN